MDFFGIIQGFFALTVTPVSVKFMLVTDVIASECITSNQYGSVALCCTLLHAKALFSPSRWNMNFNPLACYRNFLSCRKWSIIKIWHFMIFKNEFSMVSIILYSDTQRLKPVNYTVKLLGSLRKNLFTVFWQCKTLQQWNRENTGMANVW